MRRITWIVMILLAALIVLSGCVATPYFEDDCDPLFDNPVEIQECKDRGVRRDEREYVEGERRLAQERMRLACKEAGMVPVDYRDDLYCISRRELAEVMRSVGL